MAKTLRLLLGLVKFCDVKNKRYHKAMTHSFDGYNYIIKLQKGEKLIASLNKFAQETKLEGGWINILGGALQMTLGFYDLDKKQYHWQDFEGLYEITGITGNLAYDGQSQPIFHLHGTFAGRDFKTFGGHVKDLTAAATVEIFVHRSFKKVKRSHDEASGLQTLDLQ
jgi:uncharacterized protein